MKKYYATADVNNGVLEVFDTKEEAEKALSELIEEGNAINEGSRDDYEIEGLETRYLTIDEAKTKIAESMPFQITDILEELINQPDFELQTIYDEFNDGYPYWYKQNSDSLCCIKNTPYEIGTGTNSGRVFFIDKTDYLR